MSNATPPNTRIEKDSMGEMPVPADALYGASTARAVANFPIAKEPVPAAVIYAFRPPEGGLRGGKSGVGPAGRQTGRSAIIAAADEVAAGKHDAHFPVDIYQTGSGTSTNMNGNEVIANLANQKLGFGLSAKNNPDAVHPNDHVNAGQSSNDTFPTGMHIAGALAIENDLKPALDRLRDGLQAKAEAWDKIVKIGRTHLMDATPIRVGQVFAGYARQAEHARHRAGFAFEGMRQNLEIGGTAVGTGINTHPEFAAKVCAALKKRTGIDFEEAEQHAEAQAAKDCFVQSHACLKTIAVSLTKIANDIRHLGSGPRCGIGELSLPAIQPGSSIMPGKVNPVICESAMQVACRVVGNDATVTMAGMGGVGSIYELNVAMPVMIDAFLESVKLLANVSNVFVDKLLDGLVVNEDRCAELNEQSLMTITALAPEVGYDKCSALAKQAHKEGKTIKELVGELKLMPAERLAELMNYDAMTRPS